MLSNAYFLAKFRFDAAENEPAKNLQFFSRFANLDPVRRLLDAEVASLEVAEGAEVLGPPVVLVHVRRPAEVLAHLKQEFKTGFWRNINLKYVSS